MPHKKTIGNYLRALITAFAVCCLLVMGQAVHARTAGAEMPNVSAENLRQGLSLRGQWRFQPGDDSAWAAVSLDDSVWSSMGLPERWPQGGFPDVGHMAWYRLSLQLDPQLLQDDKQLAQLAVRMGKVLSAYELYAGGELMGGVGSMPPLSEVTYDRERVFQIPASAVGEDGTLVLGQPRVV